MQDRSPPPRRTLLQRTAGPYIRVMNETNASRANKDRRMAELKKQMSEWEAELDKMGSARRA
jgi:hypothetical protein